MQRELGESYEALLSQIKTGSVMTEKVRDVTLIPLVGDVKLVIACDSNASIGEKKNDYYKNAYEEVAVSAMKVPLMEVLATGAVPVVVVDNLCMEMEGAGKRIISIMRHQLEEAGLSNVQLTGSTEDNMPTTQSGFGVTAIGLLKMRDCRIGSTRSGDCVVCVGVPRSGIKNERYSEYDRDTAKISTVRRLAALPYVHEILPVGSKGVRYEAGQLAETAGLSFTPEERPEIDMETSAGSSTAVLCTLCADNFGKLKKDMDIDVFPVGQVS